MRSELIRMREEIRAALPERAFLRRDRGEALFITNAASIGELYGFILEPRGNMTCVLPDGSQMAALEARHAEPLDELCRTLLRFRGRTADDAALRLFARGLKLLDCGKLPPNEAEAFDRALRQRAALALRDAADCGGLYALAILNHEIQKGE